MVETAQADLATAARDAAQDAGALELAAHLAGRLCHDFISPASAIASGLDLLADPAAADMRDEALALVETSARKLVALLAFSRVAFGGAGAGELVGAHELEALARGLYAHGRAELDWSVQRPSLPRPAARALLNMAQIAAGALPTGGTARVRACDDGAALLLQVEARGPRARLRPETAAGLNGEPLGEGLAGPWVQGYFLHGAVAAASGRFDVVSEEGAEEGFVSLSARLPA